MRNKLDRKHIFYGWFIVAAGFIIMATGWGIIYNCSSLFIKPISEDLGFTRTEISATIAIRAIVQMIISLFSGKIFSKFNIKRLMQVSTIILFVSFFAHSLATSLSMFYFLTAIAALAMTLLGILPLSLIISNWFYKKRGFAIGIAFMGSGIGGMIFNSLSGLWIVNYGWQTTYQILACIILFTIAPCTFFIIHIEPKDICLSALGRPENNAISDEGNLEGLMLSEALRTTRFWIISLSLVFITMCTNTLMLSISPHLSDIGYSLRFSANIVALSMGSLAVGKLILGNLFDRLGVRTATIIACIATACGLTALVFAKYSISLIILIVAMGVGVAFATIANPIITHKIFGPKDYSAINGVLYATGGIGAVIAPILSGYFFDKTGSYATFFIILIIFCFIAIFLFQLSLPKRIKSKMRT